MDQVNNLMCPAYIENQVVRRKCTTESCQKTDKQHYTQPSKMFVLCGARVNIPASDKQKQGPNMVIEIQLMRISPFFALWFKSRHDLSHSAVFS